MSVENDLNLTKWNAPKRSNVLQLIIVRDGNRIILELQFKDLWIDPNQHLPTQALANF